MTVDIDFGALQIAHPDGGSPARPCFEIVLFYDQPRGTMKDGLANAMLAFIARSSGSFGAFKTNTMKKAARVEPDASTLVKSFVLSPEFGKPGNVGLELHSGAKADDFVAPSIKLFSEERKGDKGKMICRTFVRYCLPAPAPLDARELFEVATQCAATHAPHGGHAGYSWYWNTGDTRLEAEVGKRKGLLLNHPAMGYSDPFSFYPFIGQGLVQVGWLTFLGPALLQQAGGMEALNAGKDASVGLSAFGDGKGVVLVAGTQPVVGSRDPARAEELAPYRAVGRLLAPLRLPDEIFDFLDVAGFDDEQDLRTWYLRFFGEADE